MIAILVALLVCLAYYGYRKGRANEEHFSGMRIKYSKPSFIFGHSGKMMMRKIDFYEFIRTIYNEFPGEKANALWDMRSPYVLIRDVNLLKKMAVKDFDYFVDHRQFIDESMDAMLGNSLITMSGNKWREMRASLSPAFTGSKMRQMYQLVQEVTSGQFLRHLREGCEIDDGGVVEHDFKDLCAKYTNDLIAICAFGIEVDTLKDPDNEFYKTGRSVMDTKSNGIAKLLIIRFLPRLAKALNLSIMNHGPREFFSRMVLDTMKYREENNIVRPDMINLLMDMKKGSLKHDKEKDGSSEGFATIEESEVGIQPTKRIWRDVEIVAQCVTFFFAGFETSSTVMAIAAYELVAYPEVQQKLYEEIKATHDDLDGKAATMEIIRGLKYLDMVVSETLRMWPPAPVTDRLCTKKFDYVDEETGLEVHLEKGDNIWIPIHGYHHDPKYFPDPEKFMPERFSEENRHLINADAFIPFGIGPRSCIANRFALMEVKAFLYHLLLDFELVATQKTNVPLKITNNFGAVANDIFLGVKLREA